MPHSDSLSGRQSYWAMSVTEVSWKNASVKGELEKLRGRLQTLRSVASSHDNKPPKTHSDKILTFPLCYFDQISCLLRLCTKSRSFIGFLGVRIGLSG